MLAYMCITTITEVTLHATLYKDVLITFAGTVRPRDGYSYGTMSLDFRFDSRESTKLIQATILSQMERAAITKSLCGNIKSAIHESIRALQGDLYKPQDQISTSNRVLAGILNHIPATSIVIKHGEFVAHESTLPSNY